MSVLSRGDAGQTGRISLSRLTLRISGLAVLWAILCEGEGWIVGAPVILIATAVTSLGTSADQWSLAGIARFIPYFLWNSGRGAVDVAARALHPQLPVDPAILRYEMQLDSTAARVLMANSVTLLPGTLSADMEGNVLSVHVLNASGPAMDSLSALERHISATVRQDVQAVSR